MSARALDDVKILDFSWVMAGPAATRVLADYGATIVRVESASRPDTGRTLHPFAGATPDRERSAFFHNMNAGKRMLSLDLKHPDARAIVHDLVRWADVVMESFSPKAMRGLGYDYDSLRSLNPDLVMISTCLLGQTGPLATFAGYGNLAAALTGYVAQCGWPDRPPAGPFSAYTDYVAPRFTVCAILAALDHRRRTGEGQYIDQAQAESALHLLGPALLDYTVNGRVRTRVGNRDELISPHGVYPADGKDRWVAIAVADDSMWTRFAGVIGGPDLAGDARYAASRERIRRAAEVDELVAAWTRSRTAEAIEAELQGAGIACSVVQDSRDLGSDPQLRHRDHFAPIGNPGDGFAVESPRAKLSRTPGEPGRSVPTIGRDNEAILREILGYPEGRVRALLTSGVLR